MTGGAPAAYGEAMTKDVLLYCFDTMADWEYAYLTTVISRMRQGGDDRYRIRTASVDGEPVTTLGQLTLVPDGRLGEVDPAGLAMLVLPGGHWDQGDHGEVLALGRSLLDTGTPVAGICGATKAMASAGLMTKHAHVLDPDDPPTGYPGEAGRVEHACAVLDGELVTGLGNAPLEWTREVLRRLEADDPEYIDRWYAAFKDVPDARGRDEL